MLKKSNSFVVLLCAALLFFTSCSETKSYVVGTANGANFSLAADLSKVTNYFKKVTGHSNKEITINDYKIVKDTDQGTKNSYYMLVGKNAQEQMTIAIEVFLEADGKVGLTSTSLTNGVVFCVSSCTEGCLPQKLNNVWVCSDGCKAECAKTETKAFEENNYTTPIQAFVEKY